MEPTQPIPKRREYFRKKATERRWKNQKCEVCGEHAEVKDLLTQKKLCLKDFITTYKERTEKQKEESTSQPENSQ